jgi:Taurine catabolism dioxygenase TauD, TfdA family
MNISVKPFDTKTSLLSVAINAPVIKQRETHHKPCGVHSRIKQFYIHDTLKHELTDAASKIQLNPYKDIIAFRKEAARVIVPLLPKDLTNALKNIGQHKDPMAININNLPITDKKLCPTPKDGTIPQKNDFVSEAILTAFADVIGGKLATQNHHIAKDSIKKLQKEPIEQIVPNDMINFISDGYKLLQFIHTEDSNKKKYPDVLLALTLRGDKNAKTVFLPVNKIIADIDPSVIETLRQPHYIFSPEAGEEGDTTIESVIYKDKNGNDSIRFHTEFDATKGTTPEANQAVWTLRAYLSNRIKEKATINHEAGQLFISDNHRSLHGTFPFEKSAGQDGEMGRWIQRAYLNDTEKTV